MATAPDLESPQYKFEIIERIWNGYLRRNHGRNVSLGRDFFNNFIAHHRSFQFSMTKIFDSTTQITVDKEQYLQLKTELERKTNAVLPDINFIDMSSPENTVKSKKAFSSKQQFVEFQGDLQKENEAVHQRARDSAATHCTKLRQMLSDKTDTKFLSFDLEVHDKDRTTILEVGYVKFTLKEGDKPEYFHAIVKENLHLVNRNVSDNRENFRFGTSQRMTLKEAAEHLQKEIAGADAVVTHAGQNDAKYLARNGIEIADKCVFDTQVLALHLLPRKPGFVCWGLKRILQEMGVAYNERFLHNAGNDAHYTMEAFKALVKKNKV